jgi:hypothetical protein
MFGLQGVTPIPQKGAHLGCISPGNGHTAALSAAVCSPYFMPRNTLQKMTRAGLEPATYGLKGRGNFIPRVRRSTSKFVSVLMLMIGGVRSRSSECSGVPGTSRDKWGATRVQSASRSHLESTHTRSMTGTPPWSATFARESILTRAYPSVRASTGQLVTAALETSMRVHRRRVLPVIGAPDQR